ncbi:hypothetical protein MKC66_19945 [[Clostridium] innocuum]|nr:hypothetical protein [[Clostridium] innocuum]
MTTTRSMEVITSRYTFLQHNIQAQALHKGKKVNMHKVDKSIVFPSLPAQGLMKDTSQGGMIQ